MLLPNMALACDDVLVGGQLTQSHGTASVELLGGDAHFTAQAELAAVGEPGGGVDVDGGAVYAGDESCLGIIGIGDDGFTVARGVGGDVLNGLGVVFHALDRQDVVQELGVEVLFARGSAGDDGGCIAVQAEFHLAADAVCQLGQELGGDGLVDEQDLFRVADTGRLVLAFSMILRAISWSAVDST